MRLIRTDIRTEELEAALANMGTPGSVIEDDDLETARLEVHNALRAAEAGEGTYQDNLEDARGHGWRALEYLRSFSTRLWTLGDHGHLRISTETARTITVACGVIEDALDEWVRWADNELDNLD